jgi:hypothetical protein
MLSDLNAVNARIRNSTSTAILISTITVLALALSFTPRMSTAVTASTRNAAGTLTTPPSPGGCVIASAA